MSKRSILYLLVFLMAVLTGPVLAQIDCDDGDACTTDWVDSTFGQCTYTPVNCDDSDPCTVEFCDSQIGCIYYPLPCDDGDVLTSDSCDPQAGGCVHASVVCDDGDACTVEGIDPETGQCVFTPVDCDDFDLCTRDSCDETVGCQHTLIDCDDANLCTVDDCDPASGCRHILIDCDDGDMTTIDTCSPADGMCIHIPKVSVDIKPGSCRNPLNVRSRGLLPVVIRGSEVLDVMTINPESILMTREGFDGVPPVRYNYEDVGTPPATGALCACDDLEAEDRAADDDGGDGYMDLVLKFRVPDVADGLGLKNVSRGETILLTIVGETSGDPAPVVGTDCVKIINMPKWWEVPQKPKGPEGPKGPKKER